jgi:hypothetical protein
MLFGAVAAGHVHAAKPVPSLSESAVAKSQAGLSSAQAGRLAQANSQHLKAKARLPKAQQGQLDRLAEKVRKQLFAAPLADDLLRLATGLVRDSIPDLDEAEAESVAQYVLGAIASGGQRNAETQMSFNLQYLQLLSQMQALNRDYEAVGRILEAKHDAVENSISNIR